MIKWQEYIDEEIFEDEQFINDIPEEWGIDEDEEEEDDVTI